MLRWILALDRLLRGETTQVDRLREGTVDIPLRGLTFVLVVLGAIAGAGMGVFALTRGDGPEVRQLYASMSKVPLLFLSTLIVTFPSLYVFNALVGSRLRFLSLLRLMVASLSVTLAVLASFAPIVAFFSVSTTSYPFMVLLNVFLFAVAGAMGLTFLLQTLNRLSLIEQLTLSRPSPVEPRSAPESTSTSDSGPPPLPFPKPLSPLDQLEGHLLGDHVKTVFRCWIFLYGAVGAQMGWVLRPFIGNPGQPFEWFRERQSNFFEAVWHTFFSLFR